jgi:group II intron reverse transcriptase/maturase
MNTKTSRGNKYYESVEIQKDLYAQSKSGKRNFRDLMEMIISDENILLAYHMIKANTGSKTKGTDGYTIIHMAEQDQTHFIQFMRETVVNYHPREVRRVWIPKPNGDKRPLGIPSIIDRLVQQMFLNILQPICEAKFYNHSYGFRPNRSTRHAIARVQTLININKLHYTVDIDIKGFFDNVNHNLLIKQLWNIGIKDKRVLSVISKMLKAPIKGEGIPTKGVPQGGILSPLLSNVVLNDLDHWVADQWETFDKTRHTYSCNDKKYRALRDGSKMKEGFIVRYADDFRIMARDCTTAYKWFHAVRKFLKDRLKLDISPEKSQVINLRKKSSEFLSYKFKTAKKGHKIVAFTYVSDKKTKQMQGTLKRHIESIHKDASPENINRYNSIILGMHHYFKYATHATVAFRDLDFRLMKSLRYRLKNIASYEYPSGLPPEATYRRHYPVTRRTYKIGDLYIFPIGNIKSIPNLNYSQSTNPFDNDRDFAWDSQIVILMRSKLPNRSVEYMDNRLSVYSMQKGRCAITGIPLQASDVHCHHKTPTYLGGGDDFKILTIVHRDIHRLIHATTEETIKKYLHYFNLNAMQLRKLNQLRSLCKLNRV